MSSARTRLAILHNLPAPYRMQLFERLLADTDLDVRIFFTGKLRSNRPSWRLDSRSEDSRITHLPEIAFPIKGGSADRLNLNMGIGEIFGWHPEVVLLYGYQEFTNILVATLCAFYKIPYVLSAEMSYVWSSTLVGKISKPITRFVVRSASSLAAGSESCAQFFFSLGGSARSLRIVPPIPDVQLLSSRIAEAKRRANSTRTKFDLNGRFIVLYVGRLEGYKGIREMLKAIDKVSIRNPNVVLAIVGRGTLEGMVANQSREHPDNCRYFGSLDDAALLDLFGITDLHILPSWHEAYGVISAEALAYGVPTVVTRTSGCSDLVVDGVNGFVIEPRNPERLADAIMRASADPGLLESMKGLTMIKLKEYYMDNLVKSLKELIFMAKNKTRG